MCKYEMAILSLYHAGPPEQVAPPKVSFKRVNSSMSLLVSWDKSFSVVSEIWYNVTVLVNNQSQSRSTNMTHFTYTLPEQTKRSVPTCATYEFSVLAENPAGPSLPSSTISQKVITGDDEQVFDDIGIQ